MKDTRTVLLAAGFFLSVFAAIGLYSVYKARPKYQEDKAEAERYYSKYAILLKGIIIDKQPLDGGVLPGNYYTYTVKIAECNVSEHDPGKYGEGHYLLIKNGIANYVSHSQSSGEIGDSILVDYNKRKQYVWTGTEKRQGYDLPVF